MAANFFNSPEVLRYNNFIMQESSVRFALALAIIVSVLATSDLLPTSRQQNRWIIMLNKPWAKAIIIALCFYYMRVQPTVSFVLASLLLISINWYSQLKTAESFVSITYNNINQACGNVTAQQLLDLFNGSAYDLQRVARLCGCPPGLSISDETAPFVASLLLQSGISVNNKCSVSGGMDPALKSANDSIKVPVIAVPTLSAEVTPITTSVVAGGISGLGSSMGAVVVAAEQVGTKELPLSGLY